MNDKEKKELLERLKNHKERLIKEIKNQAEQINQEEIKIHTCYYPETMTYSFLFRYNGSKQETIPVEHKRYHPCPICHSKANHKANHSIYNTKRNNSTRLVQEEDETMKKRETEENQEENK